MIPSNPKERAILNEMIERAVQLMREQEILRKDLKELKKEVEETLGKDIAKEFTKLYKIKHDKNKALTKAEEDLDRLAELDILENSQMSAVDIEKIS